MKIIVSLTLLLVVSFAAQSQQKTKGILLEDLTWLEAEKLLTPETIVVIPLGAAAKEHGPHLTAVAGILKDIEDLRASRF